MSGMLYIHLSALLLWNKALTQEKKVTKKDVRSCIPALDRDIEITMLAKKWLALWSKKKKWSKLFLQFSNHTLSFTNLKASFTLFPFYVRKNSWGSWDFNNNLQLYDYKVHPFD